MRRGGGNSRGQIWSVARDVRVWVWDKHGFLFEERKVLNFNEFSLFGILYSKTILFLYINYIFFYCCHYIASFLFLYGVGWQPPYGSEGASSGKATL